jgi:precorrin-2 dehydrogenase / sirohydrochlorin ferrochelatase
MGPTNGLENLMSLFPMFVKLESRRCLVVGAGSVGEAKIESLLATDAEVHVIAPKASPRVRSWAESGRIKWSPREYDADDLAGVFLVIAATNSPALHDEIYAEAKRRDVLCNAVDEPQRCDFYFPAVVRRGELQIAISTGGLSPALAQRLRKELEQQFGPEWEEWLVQLGRTRDELQSIPMPPEQRKRLLHQYASLDPKGH